MSGAVVKLAPRLDTAQAGAMATSILQHAGQDLALDASEVTHVGAMGLQVMRAAAKSWQASGHTLTISGLSNDCTDQLQLLGFSPESLCQWENA